MRHFQSQVLVSIAVRYSELHSDLRSTEGAELVMRAGRTYTPSQAVADRARIMGVPMGAPPLLGMSPVCVKIWLQGRAGFYADTSCRGLSS